MTVGLGDLAQLGVKKGAEALGMDQAVCAGFSAVAGKARRSGL